MIQKALRPLTSAISGNSGSKRKKKKKYQVKVKGVRISTHYTKKSAQAKARGVRGARVTPYRGK